MSKLKTELRKYLLGSIFIASCLLGGGTAPSLWTDTLLQILILLFATPVLASREGEPVDKSVLWLCGLVVAALLIQMIPLPAGLVGMFRDSLLLAGRSETASVEFASLGLGRTLEASLYVIVLLILLLALLRMPGEQLHALLPFLLVGVACNGVAGLIQYSAASSVAINDLLPFTIHAGFFANRNHFTSLIYMALPFLVYLATFAGARLWAFLSMFLLLLVLLAAGSRAGILLGFAAVILSVFFFASRSRATISSIIGFAVVLGIYSMGTFAMLEARDLTDLSRTEFARTTLEGIKDNWLLGVGYGNFQAAYQVYENPGMVFRSYVNHAHNDFLEIIFEGGIAATLLLCAYLWLLLKQLVRFRHSHFHKAAFLGILFILIHSVVDYPLRTMALATAFVYFNAILFHRELQPQGRHIKGVVEMRDGKRKKRLLVEKQESTDADASRTAQRTRSGKNRTPV